MPYSREFQNGQAIKTVGAMVVVEARVATQDGHPGAMNSISFDARSFRSAEFATGTHSLTVFVEGLVGGQATLHDGGFGWSFGMGDLLEAVAAAVQDS